MDPTQVQALGSVAGVAAVTFLVVQIIKPALAWPQATQDRFMPLIAVLIGVVLGIVGTVAFGAIDRVSVVQAVLTGLFGGSTAVGLYTTGKALGG